MRNYCLFVLLLLCKLIFSQPYKKAQLFKEKILASQKDTQAISNFIDYLVSNKTLDQDSAIAYYEMLHLASSKAQYQSGIGRSCIMLANYYNSRGNYTKSITNLFKAEKIYSASTDYNRLGSVYNLIGNAYLGLNNKEGQLTYFTKCYNLGVQHKLNKYEAYGAGGLSNYYESVLNYNEAIKWNTISSSIFKNLNNYEVYSIINTNIASSYRKLDKLDKAEESINIAEASLVKANSNYAGYVCYKEKGDIATLKSQYETAIKYYNMALNLALKDKANHNISETYKALSDATYKTTSYKSSADYLILYGQYKDSVFNEESGKQLIDVQEKYETDKKNTEIQLLNKENDLSKSELNRKKILIYAVIAVALLLLVFFIIVIKSNIQKNKTNILLENQNLIIEQKHKEITDSINYAERIQRSFLASDELLNNNLNNYFIYFNPKAIVSGDFYWATNLKTNQQDEIFMLCTADSTGHGVPGSIMSLLNITSIESAIKDGLTSPVDILNTTRKTIIERLKRDGSQEGGKDGMDCSLISIDFKNNILTYASANNPVWIVREKEFINLPYDKMPVGKHDRDSESFSEHKFELLKGDLIYTLTDGYADQFGGEEGKKFMSKRLRELLVANSQKPMNEQKQLLETTFKNWIGNLEQVDDVTVIGIKI